MKRIMLACTIMIQITVITAGALPSEGPGDDAAGYIYEEGLKKFAVSDFPGAIRDFARVYSIRKGDRKNLRMYYKSLVRLGDIEYRNNKFPEARRLYARAIGLAGEDEGLLWKLKTIDDINDRVREEKKKNEAQIREVIRTSAAAGGILILISLTAIVIVASRRRKDHPFARLVTKMPRLDESGNIDKDYYTDIVRANRLQELLCAVTTGSLSVDILQRYLGDLDDELKTRVTKHIEKASPYPRRRELAANNPSEGDMVVSDPEAEPIGSLLLLAYITDSKTGRPGHSVRIAESAFNIASLVDDSGLTPSLVKKAALMHDIGFLGTKGRMAVKEPIGPDEFNSGALEIVRIHTSQGAKIAKSFGLPVEFNECILHHHERYDGSGFPAGLVGDEIPLIALVVGAAEYMEALAQEGSYGAIVSSRKAVTLFGRKVGSALSRIIE